MWTMPRGQSKPKPRAACNGFTLIELVIVIVLLGILVATALPSFVSLTDDAYDASPQAATGTCTGSCKYLVAGTATTCTFSDQKGGGANNFIYTLATGNVTITLN